MRCPKCNKALPLIGGFCNHCGAPKPLKSKGKKHSCLRLGLIFISIPVVGFIILVIIFGILDFRFNKALTEIQDNLIIATSAKTSGNSIITGKKAANLSLEDIKKTAEAASQKLSNISVPSSLENYRQVSLIWTSEIAFAAQNTEIWADIGNQPGDVPLVLGDKNIQNLFQDSIKIIADLKKAGAEAIKNNDRGNMHLVAAKLLVQNHWLSAILHSTNLKKVSFLVNQAYASTENPAQVPAVGKGVDVTCLVCADPKVHWTLLLRQQYGCETRCNSRLAQKDNEQTPEKQAQNNPADKVQNSPTELSSFTYKDKPKRTICIGNNAGGVFCVEDAVQSTNEIAASAIGFADGEKILSVEQWNSEYQQVDGAFLADGSIGAPVSTPTAAEGHLEGGMGTINTGEPAIPPQPKKPLTKPKQSTQPKPAAQPQNTITNKVEPAPAPEQPSESSSGNFDDIPGLKALEEGLKQMDLGPINNQLPTVDENTLQRLGADDQGNDPCRWASDSDPNCN